MKAMNSAQLGGMPQCAAWQKDASSGRLIGQITEIHGNIHALLDRI